MPIDRTASRFLVPLGALIALGVAVGVWLVPSSVLDPKPPEVDEIRTQVPEPPLAPRQTTPEQSAWLQVAEKLDGLREPDPVEEEPEPTTGPGGDDPTGAGDDDPPPPTTPRLRLNWEYEGMVTQPGKVAALIQINSAQRFVFEGDELERSDDPAIPAGTTVVLHKVERDRIILRIDGDEQEIERIDLNPPTRAPGERSPARRRRS